MILRAQRFSGSSSVTSVTSVLKLLPFPPAANNSLQFSPHPHLPATI